ncbi:MAG: transposase family protein, partial [Deinococcota bacterium]
MRSFLELPNGIPSHDTFNRVFAKLCPEAWQSCFMRWMTELSQHTQGKLISLDGKMLRGSRAS